MPEPAGRSAHPLAANPARPAGEAALGSTAAGLTSGLMALATGVLMLAVYAPTLAWLWDRWTLSVWHHAHGLIIPPVVAYFVYQELREHPGEVRDPSSWGFALLVPALGLHAIDTALHTQLLSAISLVLALPGLSLLMLGWRRTRTILFPLAFLAFMLPIPLAVTEQIHLALRHVATAVSSIMLPWLGVPVLVEGTTLHLPGATLLVADACSGFSTLYAALAVACLTAYAGSGVGRRVLVLAAAAPLAIAANGLRVVLLALLVYWQGTDVLETPWHAISGLLTFALVLPVIFWLGQPSQERAAGAAS